VNAAVVTPLLGAAMALIGAVAVGGCMSDSAASMVPADVVDSRMPAEREVEQARRQASERYLKASSEVAQAVRRARLAAAQGEREIALAQARVRFETAIRRCEGLDGELRRACLVQARSGYTEARVAARRIEYAYLD
jgi:hypothetical protein